MSIVVLAIASCQNHGHFAEEIQTVDSLQATLSFYELKLDSVDEPRLREINPQVNELYEYLSKNYLDSLDRSFWITKLNGMTIVKKGAGRYLADYEKLSTEINYTQQQLATLRNSLADEKITEEDADQYLRDEASATGEIILYVNKLQGPARLSIQIWDTLHPQMRAMADSLQALP